AQDAQLLSDRRWYVAEITLAQQAWKEAQVASMLKRLDVLASRPAAAPDLRGFEWYYLQRLSRPDLGTLRGHRLPRRRVLFSPDGHRLASAGGEHGKPGEIRVWDLAKDREILTLRAEAGPVWSVAFSPDGRRLAAACGPWSKAGEVKVWDVT